MTITNSTNKAIFAGNGVQTAFTFAFNAGYAQGAPSPATALSYLTVTATDVNGNQTAVLQGSGPANCQITLNAPVAGALWGLGGTINYNPNGTPLPAGSTLTVLRTVPLAQLVSLSNQGGLFPSTIEMAMDLLDIQIQQLSEAYGRALVVPVVDANAPLPLPAAAQRANQGLAFDVNGNPIAAALPTSGVISSAMQPVVSAASLASALIQLAAAGPATWVGRQTYAYSPVVYDLGSNQWSANQIFTQTGITVPAGNTYANIAMRQTNSGRNTATIGANAQFDGIYVDLESLSGSDPSSNCYAAILHVTNDGPGTTKAVHAGAYANTGCTGALVAVNLQMIPVGTINAASSLLQVSPTQNAGVADGLITGINIVSSDVNGVLNNVANNGIQYNYVIGCPVTTVPVKTAFMEWQVGSTSGANARFLQLLDVNGNEIQYVKKTGEVVSSAALIAGTETNGINITQSAITRTAAAGTLTIAAGTAAQLILQAGGVTGLQINSDGSLAIPSTASVAPNGTVGTTLGSFGPTGSHTSPQGWFKATFNGTVGYIPFF